VIKAFDFFCGAGGLTRGLLDAGIEVLAGIDVDAGLKETYDANNAGSTFVCDDITTVDIRALRRRFHVTNRDTVLYAACTPCQPFSTLNQMKGQDDRKSLLLTFGKLVRRAPPDLILVENVPGLSNFYGREIYLQFLDILAQCGFDRPAAALLDAAKHGVPQVRKRFILLAARDATVSLPDPNTGASATVRQQLSKYPAIADGVPSAAFANHMARRLQPHHKKIVQAVPKNGGNRSDVQDTSILLKCHQDNPTVHKDVFGRMSWDAPAPTLTCRCTDVYCGRFTHPEQDRGISLREAAALQTFGDDYVFHGTYMHIQKQIGNAVPVKLASRLGRKFVELVND
jgi:DNA (cytosine-5)-methyltransferase 1